MGFLQGRIGVVNRLDASAPIEPDASVAVIVPVAAHDVTDDTAVAVVDTALQAGADRVIVPARGPHQAVRSLAGHLSGRDDRVSVLWCNAPSVERRCAEYDIPSGGKGRDVWLALGPAAASAETVVCVDGDATAISSHDVMRLAASVDGSPRAGKAFYTRIEDGRLYGRLCRLLVRPLLLALADTDDDPLYRYLETFRYPLAGEVALDAELVSSMRIPVGMGLEIGMLGELYRLAGFEGTVQVDLGNHQHVHRPVDGDGGLVELAPTVSGALASVTERHGSQGLEAVDPAAFTDWGERLIAGYERDARLNGLSYDVEAEREQLHRYAQAVVEPEPVVLTPSWAEVDLDPHAIETAAAPERVPSER